MVVSLEIARPVLPSELDDRAQDAGEPLLAIADQAGGDWPDRARRALVELHGGRELDDESAGVRLLADIQTAFAERDRIATADLLAALHALDEAPWGDWYGKPLSARKLAEKLRPYGVHSRTVGTTTGAPRRGSCASSSRAPGAATSPPSPLSKRHNATTRSGSGMEPDFKTPQDGDVADTKSAANPLHDCDVADVADRDAQEAAEAEIDRLQAKFPDTRSDVSRPGCSPPARSPTGSASQRRDRAALDPPRRAARDPAPGRRDPLPRGRARGLAREETGDAATRKCQPPRRPPPSAERLSIPMSPATPEDNEEDLDATDPARPGVPARPERWGLRYYDARRRTAAARARSRRSAPRSPTTAT